MNNRGRSSAWLTFGFAIPLLIGFGNYQASAGEGDTAPIIPFEIYREGLAAAPATDYVGKYGPNGVATAANFEEMRAHLLNMVAIEHVTHSYAWGAGSVFDCVPILEQPGARLSRLHSVKPPPPAFVKMMRKYESRSPHDAYGNSQQCENGTEALLRTTLSDLARFESLERVFAKEPTGMQGDSSASRGASGRCSIGMIDYPNCLETHEYVIGRQSVLNVGMNATIGLADPKIAPNATDEIFSLAQVWSIGESDSNQNSTQTIEGGWQVYPQMWSTTKPVLFVYFTANDYGHRGKIPNIGCYNTECGAFVINGEWGAGLGGSLSCYDEANRPPRYQVAVTTSDWTGSGPSGDWSVLLSTQPDSSKCPGGGVSGYYPKAVFGNGLLTAYATTIEVGGETVGHKKFPPMGNGVLGQSTQSNPESIGGMTYFDTSGNYASPDFGTIIQTSPSLQCYSGTFVPTFYFGGPGGGAECKD